MNKADKIFIALIVFVACFLYIPSLWSTYRNQNKQKEVVVSYKDKEVLRADLAINHLYKVKGTLGEVDVEIKDKRVRVEKETSPNNLCSIQGWVKDANRPIVCLPNNIVVQIETNDMNENDVDVVIQ